MMETTILKQHFETAPGILKASDILALGYSRYDIARLCQTGELERVKNGYYCLPGEVPDDAQLIKALIPQGILCMDTALFHYGYIERTPLNWHVAVDKDTSRSRFKVDYPSIKPYYLEPKLLDIGATQVDIDGVQMRMYDRERVICDCFKYRNKMDVELFASAVNAYARDAAKRTKNLVTYAKQLRVYNKLMPVMEVVLNG